MAQWKKLGGGKMRGPRAELRNEKVQEDQVSECAHTHTHARTRTHTHTHTHTQWSRELKKREQGRETRNAQNNKTTNQRKKKGGWKTRIIFVKPGASPRNRPARKRQ